MNARSRAARGAEVFAAVVLTAACGASSNDPGTDDAGVNGRDAASAQDARASSDGSASSDGASPVDADAPETAALDATSPDGAAAVVTNRASSIPIGIENVNDSPMKDASYRALLRFVPDKTIKIDRMYFGFKLRGAACWDAGNAGYGAGDGGTPTGFLMRIAQATGFLTAVIARGSV